MAKDQILTVSAERKRGSTTRDSETGMVYPSRNQIYRALAPQSGLDPEDQYGWYTLCRMFPGRFIDIRTGQPIYARASVASKTGTHQLRETEVQMGPQGRLVIPSSLRKAMGLQPGDKLSARIEEDRLVLEKRECILARLKARFRTVPESVSLVDELLEERRAEARREKGG